MVRSRAHNRSRRIGGWLLGRFVELDVPQPLADYASSAGMRIVAWTELNRVNAASGKLMPQYLLVGTHGPEGQPCDFTDDAGVHLGQTEGALRNRLRRKRLLR